jgi:hypothetical protein
MPATSEAAIRLKACLIALLLAVLATGSTLGEILGLAVPGSTCKQV